MLHLSKIEVYKRNKPGYIISSKPDGLGMRIASILVGMYLAKKLDFNFGFIWPSSIDLAFMGITDSKKEGGINYLGNCMDEVDVVFNQKFIDDYFLDESKLEHSHGNFIRKEERTFQSLREGNFEKSWGWYSTDILPSNFIKDCDEIDCLRELKNIYKELGFSKEYELVISDVEKIISKLNDSFVALHIRGGDIIFSNIRKAPNFTPVVERLFPYEIALEIAIMELKNNRNIIVFGQDLNANKEFVDYLRKIKEFKHLDIINVDDLISKDYTEMQRAFFEINFMSKAEKIYSAKESVFSKCAMMISGENKLLSFHDIFSKEQQFSIIKNNINILKLHNFQYAMSYFRLFQLAKDLRLSVDTCIDCLNKALELDSDNDAYTIYTLQCFLNKKQYDEVNSRLKLILNSRYDEFFKVLLDYSLGSFNDCYEDYKHFDNPKYPYIAFVGSVISGFLGDKKQAQYLRLIASSNSEHIKNELLNKNANVKDSAVNIVKSDIRYKLGNALVQMNLAQILSILSQEKKYRKFLDTTVIEDGENLRIYPDYDDALKCKNHLSYRLGELLLNTHNNKFKIAYLSFPYKAYKIYREFKNDRV